MSNKNQEKMDRKQFLKISGLAAGIAGTLSVGGAGLLNGKSPYTYQGWENTTVDKYFDRSSFEVDSPKYEQIGEPKRVSYLTHRFSRMSAFMGLNMDNPSEFPAELREWYEEHPDALEEDKILKREVVPQRAKTMAEIGDRYILRNAFFDSYSATRNTSMVDAKPEEFDWRDVREQPYKVKDPAEMSKLIKKVGRKYGSSLVRIAKFKPIWAYDKHTGGRGYDRAEPIEVPSWWQYAIVVGVPHEWNQKEANPNLGASIDAYNETSIAAARLTSFIKQLGYAARPHSPDTGYEVIIPPILVDAGVGEQGRFGFVVTPEFGGNFRPAVITTNIPVEPDSPIDANIKEFCMECKICAEECPSQSISYDGPGEIRGRGYSGWQINIETCHNYWMSVPGSGSCRVCLAVCPFSRPANWLHKTARDVAVRDGTGITASMLTWMEKTFYGQHDPAHYRDPNWGTVGDVPWWFDTERFIDPDSSPRTDEDGNPWWFDSDSDD